MARLRCMRSVFPAEQVSEAFDDGGGFFMDAEVYTPPEVAVVPAPVTAAAPASSDSKKPRGLKDLERERQAKASARRDAHAHRLFVFPPGLICKPGWRAARP